MMDRSRGVNGFLIMLGIGLALVAGCARAPAGVVKLATTTSTANTGLLDVLTEEFLNDTNIRVDFIVTGTGRALTHGRNGDVDAVMVHAPAAEELFVREGYGVERVPLMWNDFVIVGPATDPAEISRSGDPAEALSKIRETKATFVSRGDDSGTHRKEIQLWNSAGIEPNGDWYVEAGQGMGACLTIAHEMQAYTLTDRGTYLARSDELELEILLEDHDALVNPYAIIAISPDRFPHVNHSDVQRFIDWLISPRGQELIAEFRVNGHQLFHLFEDS